VALRLGLHPPARVEDLTVRPHLDAVRPQMVGDVQWEGARSDGLVHPDPLARPQDELAVELIGSKSLCDELVHAELVERHRLKSVQLTHPRDLERAHEGVARAIPLDIEEGIRHRNGHLMAKLGRADGVPVNQEIPHGFAS
jgi:hypothetical protein